VSGAPKQVSRRGLLLALDPRNFARASQDSRRGLGSTRTEPGAGDPASELTGGDPHWRDGLEQVLAQMNDLSGIEEP
jgi:hypothetical protein